MHQNERKTKSGPSRSPNLIMPEDYVVFSSLNLMMKNSSVSWKMLVESWKFRCQQQCLVEFHWISTGTPVATLDNTRRNMLVIVEGNESMRIRMEGSQSKNHEDHISGKGVNSLSHCNLVHEFVLMPEAMRIPGAKAAVEKEWETLGETPGMTADKSQKQKWCDRWNN